MLQDDGKEGSILSHEALAGEDVVADRLHDGGLLGDLFDDDPLRRRDIAAELLGELSTEPAYVDAELGTAVNPIEGNRSQDPREHGGSMLGRTPRWPAIGTASASIPWRGSVDRRGRRLRDRLHRAALYQKFPHSACAGDGGYIRVRACLFRQEPVPASTAGSPRASTRRISPTARALGSDELGGRR